MLARCLQDAHPSAAARHEADVPGWLARGPAAIANQRHLREGLVAIQAREDVVTYLLHVIPFRP